MHSSSVAISESDSESTDQKPLTPRESYLFDSERAKLAAAKSHEVRKANRQNTQNFLTSRAYLALERSYNIGMNNVTNSKGQRIEVPVETQAKALNAFLDRALGKPIQQVAQIDARPMVVDNVYADVIQRAKELPSQQPIEPMDYAPIADAEIVDQGALEPKEQGSQEPKEQGSQEPKEP